ncbi:MAG TPA: NAD+ synthase, partial [Pseudomonadales bacterium]|nr:NAD+ synthase [Pseudomonadales bacterium]
MQSVLNVVIAQLNFHVGDIDGNARRVIATVQRLQAEGEVDVVVFPELTLTGYPPEDLLLRPSMQKRIERALEDIKIAIQGVAVVLGCPYEMEGHRYNCAALIRDGRIDGLYKKQHLPNYQVFDEVRYFRPGEQAEVLRIKDIPIALMVCEDIWFSGPAQQAHAAGAALIITINASPFHINKQQLREDALKARVAETGLPILYANMVGGQDELVFDGNSLVIDQQGKIRFSAPAFEEGLYRLQFGWDGQTLALLEERLPPSASVLGLEASVYQAMVLGLRDYVNKNRFPGVMLGLSGGIDSALTLAVAVDALGAERVQAVMMPFHYTSAMSIEDAKAQAQGLGVTYHCLPIEAIYDAYLATLTPVFAGRAVDKTEENLQARCRGTLLMALSNKFGAMVLTTGNKSEMAVGYATLYGDMVGGYNVLKDVYKTLVFRLAHYRNSLADGPVIPLRV